METENNIQTEDKPKSYKISADVKNNIKNFILSNNGLHLVLNLLSEPEKDVYTEDEMNLIIRYLGKLRMEEVFQIVESFKTSIEEIN